LPSELKSNPYSADERICDDDALKTDAGFQKCKKLKVMEASLIFVTFKCLQKFLDMKNFMLAILSCIIFLNLHAQYKRKGETLQSHSTTKKKKASFSLLQFSGKWQEIIRKKRSDSSAVVFNDSIQLKFYDNNKVQTKTSVATSLTLKGEAEIDEEDNLYAAADVYSIKSVTANQIVLDDNSRFIHTLIKMDSFWYEKLGKDTAKREEFSAPIEVQISSIMGKWYVYRRQAKPGAVSENEQLIKYFNVLKKSDATTAMGNVTFFRSTTTEQLPCTVALMGKAIRIIAGNFVWDFSVYQADSTNLVFGDNHLKYFCKPANGN
jgi:hypothetical protein